MLSNSSLRTRIAYDIAVRYATPLWRVGAAFRAACVGGLWVLLAWFPPGALLRSVALLLVVSAGVSLAWVQAQPAILDRLESGRIAGLRKTAWHLRGARSRATARCATFPPASTSTCIGPWCCCGWPWRLTRTGPATC